MNKKVSITGLIILGIGIYALFNNVLDLSFLRDYVSWEYIWPILLIIVGIRMISKRW